MYGRHMTIEEVNAFTRPQDADVATIETFLGDACSLQEINAEQGVIRCEITIADAERLLHTVFRIFVNSRTHQSVVRATVSVLFTSLVLFSSYSVLSRLSSSCLPLVAFSLAC
jgi:hypothetical protein